MRPPPDKPTVEPQLDRHVTGQLQALTRQMIMAPGKSRAGLRLLKGQLRYYLQQIARLEEVLNGSQYKEE